MDEPKVLYQKAWSRYELLGVTFDVQFSIILDSDNELMGLLLTRSNTREESRKFRITAKGGKVASPLGHTGMNAGVEFVWLERHPSRDVYRFRADFVFSAIGITRPIASQEGSFQLKKIQPELLGDGEILQWFTTRATLPDSEITLVIDTAPSEGNRDFFELLGNFDAQPLTSKDNSPGNLLLLLIAASEDDVPADEFPALASSLGQTQIVVSHSPLNLQSVSAALQHATTLGAAGYLVTHPHYTPIVLISWAGLDIFFRVERKVADRVAHHMADMTDRLFEVLHLSRAKKKSKAGAKTMGKKKRNASKEQKATKGGAEATAER